VDTDKLSVRVAGFVGMLIYNKTRGCCVVCCREKKWVREGELVML
jgi:hypothetical protein